MILKSKSGSKKAAFGVPNPVVVMDKNHFETRIKNKCKNAEIKLIIENGKANI